MLIQRLTAIFYVIGMLTAGAFAGQSVVASGASVGTFADPNRANTLNLRVELQLHSFTAPAANTYIVGLNGAGLDFYYRTDNVLQVNLKRDTVSGGSPCFFDLAGRSNVLLRIQRDYTGLAWYCEMWNVDGTGYFYESRAITTVGTWPFDGGSITETTNSFSLGFLRLDNDLVATGARQPVTAEIGDITELKFDGDGTDSSGNAHNATLTGFTFESTPGQGAFAVIKTPNTPNWAPFLPLRAGHPSQITGTDSFSMADTSSSVSCFWQQIPHASYESVTSHVHFDDRTSCTPTLTGLVFGPYKFRLRVTDSGGAQDTTDFDVGAVAYDDNGVVIYPDPRLDVMLGETLVFGANPWSYADRQEFEMNQYKWSFYEINNGPWFMQHEKDVSNGVTLTGTVYATSGVARIYGVGTNFKAAFGCASDGAPVTGTQGVVVHVPRAGGGPPINNTQTVLSCVSDTEVVTSGNWNYATTAAPGNDWGVNWSCSPHCGNWNTDGINYYDNALAHYTFYYRTGWIKARDAARWLADRWYRSPQFSLPEGYGYIPRRAALQSAWIYSQIDAGASLVWSYDPLEALRDMTTRSITALDGNVSVGKVGDNRETAYRLSIVATHAYLDPDSAERTAKRAKLSTYYTSLFGPEQEAGGNYIGTEAFEGSGDGRVMQFTNGSATVTKSLGPDFDANYCGTFVTEAGTITIAADDVTVTGTGTSFTTASAGQYIYVRGTLNSAPWSMGATIASIASNTSMVLAQPWRGDDGSVTDYRIISAAASHSQHPSYIFTFYAQSDSAGAWAERPVDLDNWYWCRVNSGTQISLDKPYTGDTSVNNYRIARAQDLVGWGTQPFMMGITGWAFHLAASALDGFDATNAANYRSSAAEIATWIYTTGRNSDTNGLRYSVGHSNCTSLNFPAAYQCWANAPSSERSYNIESFNLFSRSYLATGGATLLGYGNDMYQWTYCNTSYSCLSAYDGYHAEAVDDGIYSLNESLTNKNIGQAWGMGGGQTWPAARLGGPAAPENRTIEIQVASPLTYGDQLRVTAINASGVSVSNTCAAAQCSVTSDFRAGSQSVLIEYLEGSTVVATTTQNIIVD